MKRYKDCSLLCKEGQEPTELLDLIEQVSREKKYEMYRNLGMRESDSLSIRIQKEALPYSRLVLLTNNEAKSVDIINIVPMPESGESQIDCEVYNKLLDAYRDDVFVIFNQRFGNDIKQNTEDYTIEEVIPKSYPLLNTWLNGYPLSSHPNDTERWYDFVIRLHNSGEHLPLSDFEEYIKENYRWDDATITRFSLKLESQLMLLKYYDRHKCC